MYKTVKFKMNFNGKLDNSIFTTIRAANYGVAQHDYCVIVLNDRVYKWVQCIEVSTLWFGDISQMIVATDTGLTGSAVHDLFNKCGLITQQHSTMVDLILFKTVVRPKIKYDKPGQESLSSLFEVLE